MDLDTLLYGDVASFRDLFLPEGNTKKVIQKEDPDIKEDDWLDFPFEVDPNPIKVETPSFEVSEYNDLLKTCNNLTRRYQGWWQGMYDAEDKPKNIENKKSSKINHITLQFLIHARYHVKKAIEQKQGFQLDTRYKMGYLYNRMRRIRYEQLKLVSTIGNELRSSYWKELFNTLRVYEKVVRYDVDLKDTILLIRKLHKQDSLAKDAAYNASYTGRTRPN